MFKRRSRPNPLADAVRRAHAVLAVMTEELGRELPSAGTPGSRLAPTSTTARARAAASLGQVEAGLAEIESMHAEARVRERDWTRRAELAAGQGRRDLVDHSRQQAIQAAEDAVSYAKELDAARTLLHDWSGRLE